MEIINKILNSIEHKDKTCLKNSFKLPIELIDKKYNLNTNIIEDLELKKFKKNKEDDKDNDSVSDYNNDSSNNYNNLIGDENLYYNLLNNSNILQKNHTQLWSNYYTTDISFLYDTQNLLDNFKSNVCFDIIDNSNDDCIDIYNSYEDIINDNNFIDKYQYIDFPFFEKYNKNETSMLFLSLYNLSSPVLSLLIPIISLILPFLIIKLQGFEITIELYISHLKNVMANHVIGQMFNDFNNAPLSTKIYLIISFGFYLFQIYSNINCCKKYFTNIKYINNTLLNVKDYITNSVKYFNNYLKYSNKLISYSKFNSILKNNIVILEDYNKKLSNLSIYKINVNKIFEMGNIMKNFYLLYNDEEVINALYYSFECRCYINNIINIQQLIKNKTINKCNFINNNSKKTSFKNAYYCNLIKTDSENIIKNSFSLKDNLVITGPNAAGKTTLLKSTLFNIILSQQIGYGFFDEANIKLYDYIHCYINIPDTSNRDSLFQAEARQCKDILQFIEENSDKNHLCVFDELFSGTNPEDAIKSGYGYLNHINKENVNFILTSHYHKLCKMLEKDNTNINNYHMEIKKDENNNFSYTYKIKKGINKKKGGLKVLNDLNFPKTMITNIKNIKNINKI